MTKINVGTIGHVDHGKTTVAAALMLALANNPSVPSDPEPVMVRYAKVPELEPKHCMGWNTKKSKGDKHRDRAERRRKWGV